MILCDLPYGITACKWDSIIPLEPLWKEYKRVIKKNGAIVLTASQPFTSILVMSNLEWFKYEWIWEKSRPTGHLEAKNKPLRKHENILLFSGGSSANGCSNRIIYNPQNLISIERFNKNSTPTDNYGTRKSRPMGQVTKQNFTNYPTTIIREPSQSKTIHPTQKPVALFEYLIKTYTNEDGLVLDNCMGSGTTAIACINLNRHYIGCELEKKYYDIAIKRIEESKQKVKLL